MKRDVEATKSRILAAAAEEFSRYGVAGARVDRIAKNAEANKRAIYDHFGSKEGLFLTVLRTKTAEITQAVSLQPESVQDYPVDLFRFFSEHPDIVRLLMWDGLSAEDIARPDSEEERNYYRSKIDAIAPLTGHGALANDDPRLLAIVLVALGMSWFTLPQVVGLFLGHEPTDEDKKVFDAYLREITDRVLKRDGA